MRTLSAGEITALQGATVPMAVLVELSLSTTVRLCTGGIDLVVGGNTYYGTQGLGRIDTVADSPAEIKPLGFEITGVSSAAVSLALNEPVRGRDIIVSTLLLDASYQPLTQRVRWQGKGDMMVLREQGGTAAIQVRAEHCMADLLRGTVTYWSDAEQRRLYSNDPSLQFMADQVEQRIVWPAASYFRK